MKKPASESCGTGADWVEPNVGSPEMKPRPLTSASCKSPKTEQRPLSCLRSEGVWLARQAPGVAARDWGPDVPVEGPG